MNVRVEGGREVIAMLDEASRAAPAEVEKVVVKGSVNVKLDWRRRWSGHAHIPVLPYAISFDVTSEGGTVTSEIGPDQSKPQGSLAGIINDGSPTSSPLPGAQPALEAEAPRFEKALLDIGAKLLGA